MYMQDTTLDGFNPLKAIGRALGGAGRAVVGAVVPIAGQILDTAAHQAAAPDAASTHALNTLVAQAQTTAPPPAAVVPTNQTPADAMLQAVLTKFVASTQPIAAPVPSAPVVVTTSAPAPSYTPSAMSSLPSWAIPAALGAGLLMFMASRKK